MRPRTTSHCRSLRSRRPWSALLATIVAVGVLTTTALPRGEARSITPYYFLPDSVSSLAELVQSTTSRLLAGSAYRDPEPSHPQFRLDMAIHHTTDERHFGKSATVDFRTSRSDVTTQDQSRQSISGVQVRKQRIQRLRDPQAYLAQREAIIDASRAAEAMTSCEQPSVASSQLDELHSLLDWDEEDVVTPDVTKRSTLLALARMSSAAYEWPPNPPAWQPTPGFEDWNVSDSFGWVDNGIRGHVFSSGADNDIVVLALKGTSAAILPGGDDTARRDKLNDNLLFSCCCARVSWTWSPVCPCPFSGSVCSQPCLERSLLHKSVYYPLITDLYNNVSYMYPNSQIWVTGHSLGGALASLIGHTFGVPGITYEAPAERMAARRLHLPMPPGSRKRPDGKQDTSGAGATSDRYDPPVLPITHVFHTADPIPLGECTGQTSLCGSAGYAMESRCHAGQAVVYNTTGLLGWSSNVATHRIANLVDDLLTEDWGERVRKEYKRTHSSAAHDHPDSRSSPVRFSWWPWNGNKGKEREDDSLPDWLINIGETPSVENQDDCVDCGDWKFVDEDKTK